jgi:hypothetical protein
MKINEKDDHSNVALIPGKETSTFKLLNNNAYVHNNSIRNNNITTSNDNNISMTQRSTQSAVSIIPFNWLQNEIHRTYDNKNKVSFTFISNQTNEIEYTAIKTGMFSYVINNNNNKVATISSNVLSKNFILYNNNKIPLMKIKYNINILGLGGLSQMEVVIPKGENNEKDFILCNKQPQYNVIYKCLVLKFIARTIIRSAKNFQLVKKCRSYDDSNINNSNNCDDVYFQFAKVDNDKYICDFKEPFNSLYGFALGIIALSQKMLCEQIKDK